MIYTGIGTFLATITQRKEKFLGLLSPTPVLGKNIIFKENTPAGNVHPTGSKCPFHKTDSDIEVSNHITKPPINNFIDLQTEPFKSPTDYVARTKESDEKYNTHLKTVRETEILKAPSMGTISKTGTIINRTDEEINERIEYYKQLLKQQILDAKNRRNV